MIAADGTAIYPWNHGETLTAAALNAAIAQAAEAGSADFANIRDYGAGSGGDDAAAFRAALASGNRVIYCPPGDYTFRTKTTVPGPMNFQPTPFVLFNGVSNLVIIAYGAAFYIDPAATVPDASRLNAGNAHCGFIGNCQNVVWKGGRFYGNTTNAGSAVNTGMWFQNVTGVLVEDTEWLGDYHAAPIFGGVWMFDCTFRNNRCYGAGNGFDFAYQENLTLTGNRFDGLQIAGSGASCGFKLFTDPATKGFNTSGQTLAQSTWLPSGAVRQLRGGMSNNIRLANNIFVGWSTGVYLDGVDSAIISDNAIRDGGNSAGITVLTSSDTTTAGFMTRDVLIYDNEIYGNAAPGVIVAPGTNGIGPIEVVRNRIYDNTCLNAIQFNSNIGVATFRLTDNDFLSRTGSGVQQNPYNAATLNFISATYRQNFGALPYDQAGAFSTVTATAGVGAWSTTPPASKPVVTGAKGGNAALASLLSALVSYGLITDSSGA